MTMEHPGPPAVHPLRRHPIVPLFLLHMIGVLTTVSRAAAEDLRAPLLVVGCGPERPVIEKLSQGFEKVHVGTVIDIMRNRNVRIVEMVKASEADLAVSGAEEADLPSTLVARDGLAVIVNFSNPVKEVTLEQVAALFSGRIRDGSELHEQGGGKVQVVLRTDDQNLTVGFEHSLGIVGAVSTEAERVRSDQQVLSRVSGQLNAVGYLSLKAALDAVTYGMSVQILVIDNVEPGKPTVQSGQYQLKRPVMFLTRKRSTPITKAFIDFALSKGGQRILDDMYVPLAE